MEQETCRWESPDGWRCENPTLKGSVCCLDHNVLRGQWDGERWRQTRAYRCGWKNKAGDVKCVILRVDDWRAHSCEEHRCAATYKDELGEQRCWWKAEQGRLVCRTHRFRPGSVPHLHDRVKTEIYSDLPARYDWQRESDARVEEERRRETETKAPLSLPPVVAMPAPLPQGQAQCAWRDTIWDGDPAAGNRCEESIPEGDHTCPLHTCACGRPMESGHEACNFHRPLPPSPAPFPLWSHETPRTVRLMGAC